MCECVCKRLTAKFISRTHHGSEIRYIYLYGTKDMHLELDFLNHVFIFFGS